MVFAAEDSGPFFNILNIVSDLFEDQVEVLNYELYALI